MLTLLETVGLKEAALLLRSSSDICDVAEIDYVYRVCDG